MQMFFAMLKTGSSQARKERNDHELHELTRITFLVSKFQVADMMQKVPRKLGTENQPRITLIGTNMVPRYARNKKSSGMFWGNNPLHLYLGFLV